jgi:DNA-binding FadR family transcriptional regulator
MEATSTAATPAWTDNGPELRLYQTVARQIADLIARDARGADWRLPSERELAEELGVSRPVIREAVIALEMRGIVEVRGRSGVIAKAPAESFSFGAPLSDIGPGPFELLEARLAIESSAAALAAEKITAEGLDYLSGCIARMEQETNVELLNEAGDRDFHAFIAEATNNSLIISMVKGLWNLRDASAMWRKLHEHIHAPTVRPLWIGDHYAVLTALRLHNPDAAYKAMRKHIRNVISELMTAEEAGRLEL